MEVRPGAATQVLLGTRPDRIRRIASSGNDHWHVTAGASRYVLRRFARVQESPSIEWEQSLIRLLASRGWPVPVPVAGPAELGGRYWMLMRRIPGRPMATTPATSFERGRMLARLHRDLSAVEVAQRPGWTYRHHAATQLPALLDDLPAILDERIPGRSEELSGRMADFTHRVLHRLSETDLSALPASVVHGDLLPWNVLVHRGVVSGLLDFEKAHVDLQASDVAFATWGGRYEADVVAGYRSELPRAALTTELLQLLWATTCLFSLQHHLHWRRRGFVVGGLGWSIDHALRSWGS